VLDRLEEQEGLSRSPHLRGDLDAAVWAYVEARILKPELIADEVERMKRRDPLVNDVRAMECAIAERQEGHRKLLGNLAAFEPGSRTAQAMVAQLKMVEKELDALDREWSILLARQRNWNATQARR
jgi:hypothetical protein